MKKNLLFLRRHLAATAAAVVWQIEHHLFWRQYEVGGGAHALDRPLIEAGSLQHRALPEERQLEV